MNNARGSAITGVITDPRTLMQTETPVETEKEAAA